MDTTAILFALAPELIKHWKKKTSLKPERTPTPLRLAAGLELLTELDSNLRDAVSGIKDPTSLDKGTIESIESAITLFQQDTGALENDGVLGGVTLSDLLTNFTGCPNSVKESDAPISDRQLRNSLESRRQQTGRNWYCYYKKDVPRVRDGNAHELIRVAWSAWQKCARIGVEELGAGEEDKANVLFDIKSFSGPVLGEASIGVPGQHLHLNVWMDSSRDWTADQFLGAVCHEIGHLLGIRHAKGPGALMSPYIKEGITLPTPSDCNRAQSLHGAPSQRPAFEPLPEIPGIPT